MCTGVLVRVAAAEALMGGGYAAEARGALDGALRQMQRRADQITHPRLRVVYLEQRHENRRARELERSFAELARPRAG